MHKPSQGHCASLEWQTAMDPLDVMREPSDSALASPGSEQVTGSESESAWTTVAWVAGANNATYGRESNDQTDNLDGQARPPPQQKK